MTDVYRLSDPGVRQALRRRMLPTIPAVLVILAVVTFAHSAWPPTKDDWIVFLLTLLGLGVIVGPIAWLRVQDQWVGFEVELAGGNIRRSRPGVANQEWPVHDIRELGWTSTGDLRVRGPNKRQEIQIPPEIDGFEDLLARLSQGVPVSPKPLIGATFEFLLITCGMLGFFAGLLYATDPRLLLMLGIAGAAASVRIGYDLLTNPNVASNFRHHALHFLLPLLLCILTIVRAIRTWPQ
jgi:hypothetical protein